ncbi:MAG: metal-sulfur cluster assembly factor [Bifidobacterium sp.]|uniref:metal-sulfur cluster assembly factor n=1 Tax=Bifidobacterium sp. TaxID=41200 RepID=UPI003F070369
MTNQGNLVPEPKSTIFDTVSQALGNDNAARKVMANPQLLGTLGAQTEDTPGTKRGEADTASESDRCACGKHSKQECKHDDATNSEDDIPLVAVDDIGRATAADVKEALHQVIDPELGIDVIDLGLVYGIEIDNLGRAIITMTLTTPACPLTELIEDECASTLAGLVEEFRIDWTWQPRWTVDKITPEGREQLAAIGFNLDAMPQY